MKQIFTFLFLGLFLGIIHQKGWTQPAELGHASRTGGYENVALADRGATRFLRYQATGNHTNVQWAFCLTSNNYSTNWRPYTAGQSLSSFNTKINPASAPSSARYNTSSGGQNGQVTVVQNRYYTWIVEENSTSNNFMSVLETTYNPVNISSVTNLSNIYGGQTPTVTVSLSATPSSGEFVYLRYSTDGFMSSTILSVSVAGSTGTVNMPAFSNGTTVQYYVFTSNQSSIVTVTDADYFTLNLRNFSGENVSGSNFNYTVLSWQTVADGNWNSTTTWNANAVPSTSNSLGAVTVANDIILNQNATVSNLTIASGKTLTVEAGQARVLTLTGTFTNNGTANTSFVPNVGKVVLSGTGNSITGNGVTFYDLDLAGSGSRNLDLVTVNNNLTIKNNSNSISMGDAPTYGSASTLVYDVAGPYTLFQEWYENTFAGSIGYPNNVTIKTGTTLNSNNTSFSRELRGNLTIETGAILILGTFSGGDLKLKGDFSNAGTYNDNTRATFFNGNSLQNINSTSNFSTILIQNAAGVSLGSNINITNTLNMSAGNINTGANTLTLGTGTGNVGTLTHTGGTIIGIFKRWLSATAGSRFFPIGTSIIARNATIDFTSAPSVGGTLTAQFIAGEAGSNGLPLTQGTIEITSLAQGVWRIEAGDGLTGGIYTATINGFGFSGVTDVSKLVMLKRNSSNALWTIPNTHITATGTLSTPVISRSGLSGFSEFGMGGSGTEANPLPITLTSFTAEKLSQDKALLTWKTASEINNKGFEIQKSEDGIQFESIGFITGAGKAHTYQFTDEKLNTSTYYRLKQLDFGDTFSYSPIVFVENNHISVYPNPTSDYLTIAVGKESNLPARLLNAQGKEVWKGTFTKTTQKLSLRTLPAGAYFLHITQAGKPIVEKIIVR